MDTTHENTFDSPGDLALDRASLDRVFSVPSLCHLDEVRAAVNRADYDDAAVRTLARIKLGMNTPSELLVEVLIGMESSRFSVFLALTRRVSGDVLADQLGRGRFGAGYGDLERTMYVAFALWQSLPHELARTLLVALLRRIARWHQIPLMACAVLGWLTVQIDDVHLREQYEQLHGAADNEFSRALVAELQGIWKAPLDEIIAALPAEMPLPFPDAVPVRAPPKVGRNDPCPCGSGQKYKRCHADRPDGPMRARLSRNDVLRVSAPRLEPGHIVRMPRGLVAALDPTRLRDETLTCALQYLSYAHDWQRARRARDEVVRRHGRAEADKLWRGTVYEALRARQFDVARELFAELNYPAEAGDLQFELRLHARGHDTLAQLEKAAEMAVRGGPLSSFAVARAALHTMPALGILLARGACLDTGECHPDELTGLLHEIEEARNELGVPPNDPARSMYGDLGEGSGEDEIDDERDDPERARLAQAAAHLQAKLDETTRRLDELQRQVAEQARDPAPIERPIAPPRPAASTDAEQRARQKQQRIDELEAMIRERNAERAELRRRLAEVTSQRASPAQPPAPPSTGRQDREDEETGLSDAPVVDSGRRVLVPRLSSSTEASFQKVPRSVAAIAMRAIGALAIGDSSAWRGVKQAKDMPQQVLMARIGIHHRLLFRVDQERLEILELVTRETLREALKALRSS